MTGQAIEIMWAAFSIMAFATALTAAVVSFLIVRGWLPLAMRPVSDEDDEKVRRLAAGIILTLGGAALPRLYWDVLPPFLNWTSPGFWPWWNGMIRRPIPNLIFLTVLVAGLIQFLRLLLLFIPSWERPQWCMWSAPFYPKVVGVRRLVIAMREKLRKRNE